MNKVVLVIILSLIFLSCTRENGTSSNPAPGNKRSQIASSGPEDPLLHYWDNFDFADTLAVKNPELGEQALVNFIAKFSNVEDTIRSSSIKKMLSKAKPYPTTLAYFSSQFERYLYDPNSPMRNDSYYEPVLEFFLDSCMLNDAEKYRYQSLLKLIRKNSVGTPASDFDFQLPKGNSSKLYAVKAPYTLLFFYEPGCPHCDEAIGQLKNNPDFQQLIDNGGLQMLAIYAAGDFKVWKAYQPNIPVSWMNGFDTDRQILSKAIYDLKASPTIYLLDKDKVVLLKDTGLSEVASYLHFKPFD